jgi:hypothetical protein
MSIAAVRSDFPVSSRIRPIGTTTSRPGLGSTGDPPVGDKPLEGHEGGQERGCGRRIGGVAGGQQDPSRRLVGRSVELACPAASRGAERLLESPPFPPAAERYALMCVLSIAASP